jgi:hypothetical protein
MCFVHRYGDNVSTPDDVQKRQPSLVMCGAWFVASHPWHFPWSNSNESHKFNSVYVSTGSTLKVSAL